MKNKPDNHFGIITLLLLCLSCTAGASLDHLNGTLDVSGSLLAAPCSLSTESAEQTVEMGNIPVWQLGRYGALSEPVSFHLYLTGCGYGQGFVRNERPGNNGLLLLDQPVVAMTVNAVADPQDPSLVSVEGQAKGVALRLENAARQPLWPGVKSTFLPLIPGDNALLLTAQLSRTAQTLMTGDFIATVNIALEYE